MTDRTLTFLLGYLKQTQWASAIRSATDLGIDLDTIRKLMLEQKEAYNLDTGYIESMVTNDKLFKQEMKQDKV